MLYNRCNTNQHCFYAGTEVLAMWIGESTAPLLKSFFTKAWYENHSAVRDEVRRMTSDIADAK